LEKVRSLKNQAVSNEDYTGAANYKKQIEALEKQLQQLTTY